MGKLRFDLVEYNFNPRLTAAYNLSVLIRADSLYFSVYDGQQNLLILRQHKLDRAEGVEDNRIARLSAMLLSDDFLKLNYAQTTIAYAGEVSTLMPDRFFHPGEVATYLQGVSGLPADCLIYFDHLPELEMRNIFAVDQAERSWFSTHFPEARVCHVNSGLIRAFAKINSLRSGVNVYLNVHDRSVQVFLFRRSDLLFANAFNFTSAEDFIYFVLLVFEQHQLKPESVPVQLAGHITEDAAIYQMLYRYIRHLEIVPSPDFIRFGRKFSETPHHLYYALYATKLCE